MRGLNVLEVCQSEGESMNTGRADKASRTKASVELLCVNWMGKGFTV